MICKQCGFENPEDAENCTNCGRSLVSTDIESKNIRPEANIYLKPQWLSDLQKRQKSIIDTLIFLGGIAFLIGMFIAVYTCVAGDDDMSTAQRSAAFLTAFMVGVFCSGIALGFASFISSTRIGGDLVTIRSMKLLYISAFVVFGVGIAIAALQLTEYDKYYDPSTSIKVYNFLIEFLRHGFLYGSILFGFAVLISRREGLWFSKLPLEIILYIISFCALVIGAVASGLMAHEMGKYDHSFDVVITFLLTVLASGFLYCLIIAGFGGVVSSTRPNPAHYYCTNCDQDVLDEWKLCPYCGEPLDEPE